ncbi:uncharacterized protein BDR25DRAFT_28799 [Lindgomyces ingoldianus]|uniref:Uncharacterized protein n=1 Tax=Lindgomyces ingoldianus TaxID=673940 RepID=A0ACB6QVC7_9PLEO|nr:uncharacterized protein BDR25DRAFT_28799 [Lindgomyces ingoldianus]KAF2470989.1 hypothetical protein BDR25DRAFT_28799 [Lindgomyces ingoldianus]
MLATRFLRTAPKHQLSQPHVHKYPQPILYQLQHDRPHPSNLIVSRAFSQPVSKRQDASSSHKSTPQSPKPRPASGSQGVLPNLNLIELIGGNRAVYYTVLVILSIFGTIESIFWIKVIYAKFFAAEEEDEGEEKEGS